MDNQNNIKKSFLASIELKQKVLADEHLLNTIELITEKVIESFNNGGKVFFCGNGGSAADAQHLAAEFSGRFYYDRAPLFSEALHVNTSYLTAVANDYSYDEVYARLMQAKGQKGDVLIGLSTSGNSKNVVKAFEVAQQNEVLTVGFTGQTGGTMKAVSDILFNVPSTDTPRIQEVHMLAGHTVCELAEKAIFPK